jgi:radical SAM/Cys-rich protein
MEQAVLKRYKEAAKKVEKSLCCPTSYNPELLKVIPEEIIQKDYGCGDPSQYVREGETVLDLGSGAGKLCYIIAQIVGPSGRVIGIDMNDEMLAIARKYQKEIGDRLGYHNVEFRKARIQNLKLDLEKVDLYLKENPVISSEDITRLNAFCEELEKNSPLIPDNSIDVVVSNCVLNLVKSEDKDRLFKEIYRVLRDGGRAVISDIVSDEDIPEYMKNDPELWSGCISGAFREDLFLKAFEDAGFHGIEILKWDDSPWQIVNGIEFRSITVSAWKGKKGPCIDKGEAVIYRGPYKKVEDDDGHIFERGKRIAVCEKAFSLLSKKPYSNDFIFIKPHKPISRPFDCSKPIIYRKPEETKGAVFHSSDLSYCDTDCCPTFEPFNERLERLGKIILKDEIKTIQINLGNFCNQTCLHCHVEASPSGSMMDREVMEKIIGFVQKNPDMTVELTGGAPELHPEIEYFINRLSSSAERLILRTNLTALLEKRHLVDLFKSLGIELIASLPDISSHETDYIRGKGVFEKSIYALRILNEKGYGTELPLHLVHNPSGFVLPELQSQIEERYRQYLMEEYSITFNRLFVLNNMPIGRFRRLLEKVDKFISYMNLLFSNFNPSTIDDLMCRRLINISHDRRLFDCDFNNALGLERPESLNALELKDLSGKAVITSDHCYGCTALRGSGCYGSLKE